jgi:hypothetical protein
MMDRVFEDDREDNVTTLFYYSNCLQSLSRHEEALPQAKRAREMAQRIFPEGHGMRTATDEVYERIRTALTR